MTSRRATVRILLGAMWWLAALLLLTAVPQDAPAMFAGVHTAEATSALDSTADKSVTATCPAGERVLSAGFAPRGAPGGVLVDDVLPDPTLTEVTARAVEDQAGDWSARACAVGVSR